MYIVRLLDCVRVFISALWIIHWNTGLYYLCARSCIRNVVCWTIILTVGGITMVNKCAAFGCKSGYKNNVQQDTDIKITYHSFPLGSEELCDKWVGANPRSDFVPSKHSRLCSLHFKPSDFVQERADSNLARKRKKSAASGGKLYLRYLIDDAVPSIFPNAPAYLSMTSSAPRETVCATATSRFEFEACRLDVLEQSFQAADNISGLSLLDILCKLKNETALPHGFSFVVVETVLVIFYMQLPEDILKIKASLAIKENLTVAVSLEGKSVASTHYVDLIEGPVKRLSEIVNMMARMKSWGEADAVQSKSLKMTVGMSINVLEEGLETLEEGSEQYRKICFIVEQLKLILRHKQGRHYSPQLTVMSYRLHAASAAAYNVLLDENVLCLPSKTTLKKVTKRLNSNSGLDNTSYLRLRVSKLNELFL